MRLYAKVPLFTIILNHITFGIISNHTLFFVLKMNIFINLAYQNAHPTAQSPYSHAGRRVHITCKYETRSNCFSRIPFYMTVLFFKDQCT